MLLLVGAGPAGLSTAIKLKQLDPNLNVCILRKRIRSWCSYFKW